MAIQDPKRYMDSKDTDSDTEDLKDQVETLTAQVATLVAAQRSNGGMSDERLEAILVRVAQISADAQERAANPSNKKHPGISVFSYPEGDVKRPRTMSCPMQWNGYDMDLDTTTAEEIELLNLAAGVGPGVYDFKRTDGSIDRLSITAEYAPGGVVSKLKFTFDAKERRDTLPPVSDMLRYAFKVKTRQEQELDELRAQVAAYQAQSNANMVSA